MQLSATVEGMDITDRQATGTARTVHLTVNDREGRRQEPTRDGGAPVMANAVHQAAGRIRDLPIPQMLIWASETTASI